MNSYFWYHIIKFDETVFQALCQWIQHHQYSEEQSKGFIVEQRTDMLLIGTYAEKRVIQELVRDPLGQETTVERLLYDYVQFRLSAKTPHFEFTGGSRLHRQFFRNLSPAFPKYFAEQRIDFDLDKIVVQMDTYGWAIQIHNLAVDGLLINSRTVCAAEFHSSVDVREDVNFMLREKKGRLCYAKIRISGSRRGEDEIEIWRTGKVATSLHVDSLEFDKLRSIVATQCSRGSSNS